MANQLPPYAQFLEKYNGFLNVDPTDSSAVRQTRQNMNNLVSNELPSLNKQFISWANANPRHRRVSLLSSTAVVPVPTAWTSSSTAVSTALTSSSTAVSTALTSSSTAVSMALTSSSTAMVRAQTEGALVPRRIIEIRETSIPDTLVGNNESPYRYFWLIRGTEYPEQNATPLQKAQLNVLKAAYAISANNVDTEQFESVESDFSNLSTAIERLDDEIEKLEKAAGKTIGILDSKTNILRIAALIPVYSENETTGNKALAGFFNRDEYKKQIEELEQQAQAVQPQAAATVSKATATQRKISRGPILQILLMVGVLVGGMLLANTAVQVRETGLVRYTNATAIALGSPDPYPLNSRAFSNPDFNGDRYLHRPQFGPERDPMSFNDGNDDDVDLSGMVQAQPVRTSWKDTLAGVVNTVRENPVVAAAGVALAAVGNLLNART